MRLVSLVAVVLVVAVVACAESPTATSADRPFPNAILPGATRGPGPDFDCSRLLSVAEVGAAVGAEVSPIGWNLNSCYWRTRSRIVQVVLTTGPGADLWFGKLTESGLGQRGMEPVEGYDFEALVKPGSFGGFVPGRAALVHGIDDPDAAAKLIRLVLTRL